MNIQVIKDGLISGATQTYNAIKSGLIWGGHKVQAGFSNYLVPTINSLWSMAVAGLTKIAQFLKTNTGMAFGAAVSLLLVGNYLIKLSQSNNYDDNPSARTALTALGITAVAAAVLAAGVGVTTAGVI